MTTTAMTGRLDIGRVIQQTFGVIGRNAAGFLTLSALVVALPTAVVSIIQFSVAPPGPTGMPNLSGVGIAILALSIIVSLIGSSLLQVMLIRATIADLHGDKVSPMDGVAQAFGLLLPVLALSLVATVGVMIGLVLVVVPGVILMALWAVATQVLVVEKKGVFESLSRSQALTKGSRWTIFFVGLIYCIIVWVLTAVCGGIAGALGGGMQQLGSVSLPSMFSASVVSILTSALAVTGLTVVYSELRSVKEGVPPEQLGAIFD